MPHPLFNGGQDPHDQTASVADLRSTAETNSNSFADLLLQVAQAHELEVAQLRLQISHLTGGNQSIANSFLAHLNSSLVPQIHANSGLTADDTSPLLPQIHADSEPSTVELETSQEPCVLKIPGSSGTVRMLNGQKVTKEDVLTSSETEATLACRERASAHQLNSPEGYETASSLSDQSLLFSEKDEEHQLPTAATRNPTFRLVESSNMETFAVGEVSPTRSSYLSSVSCDSTLTSFAARNRPTVAPLESWRRLISYAKSGSDYVKLEQRWQELTNEEFRGKGNIIAHMLEQRKASWYDAARGSHAFDFQFAMHNTWYQWFHRATINRRLVLHPNSRFRVVWDLLGMMLLVHDFVMTPLQVFEHGTDGLNERYMNFWATLDFIASIFWTSDIFISFVTAFYSDEGFVVVNHLQIARHYLKTWFPLDLGIVTVDWIGYVLNFDSQVGYLRVGKALSRFLRILRLLRFMKLSEKFTAALAAINSEYIFTLVGVLKLLVGIITVNHYIACTWYLLSQMDLAETWSKSEYLTQRGDFDYMYLTSMHWSLTQFTPASMEVHPTNTYERLYTIVVIIGAMVTFSSFVSSITGAMTHLRMINAKKAETDAAFRRYFSTNNVSMELARQVWHFRRNNVMVNKTRMKESDLPALKFLPSRLRETLRLEVFFPILHPHPVFALLYDLCPEVTLQICSEALTERHVLTGEELKEIAYPTRSMIFVCMGDLKYYFEESLTADRESGPLSFCATRSLRHNTQRGRNKQAMKSRNSHLFRVTASQSSALLQQTSFVKITPGQWACEVSLWSDGGMTNGPFCAGESGCDLVILNGLMFRRIVQKHNRSDGVQLAAHYAKVFIERFNWACLDDDYEDILFNDEDIMHQIMSVATGEMMERCKFKLPEVAQFGGSKNSGRQSTGWRFSAKTRFST